MYSHYLVATNDEMPQPYRVHPAPYRVCHKKTISYTNLAFLNILTKSAVFKYFSNSFYVQPMFSTAAKA